MSLILFYRHFHLRGHCTLASVSYSLYVPFYGSSCGRDIRVYQVANGVIASFDGVVDLLESIEHFLKRLDIYTRIPRLPPWMTF